MFQRRPCKLLRKNRQFFFQYRHLELQKNFPFLLLQFLL
nr:MAG TPA: hypothetical protein [Caudoviricetes sp.]